MELLKGWKNDDSPRGPIMIDPQTRDIVQNEYIRRTEKVNGQLQNTEIETIPMVKDPWKEINHQQ
jgi:branched-chain amino acid transport system substrate-binding protein